MPQASPIQRQRYELIAAEIGKTRGPVWKLLGSRSQPAVEAYCHLADAQELCRQLGSDLFGKDDLGMARERCRQLQKALHQAGAALKPLAQRPGAEGAEAMDHLNMAAAVLVRLADEISAEGAFDEA